MRWDDRVESHPSSDSGRVTIRAVWHVDSRLAVGKPVRCRRTYMGMPRVALAGLPGGHDYPELIVFPGKLVHLRRGLIGRLHALSECGDHNRQPTQGY